MGKTSTVFTIIASFVMIIIGVVMIGIISTQSISATSGTGVTGEALNIASARAVANNINNTAPINFTLANAGLADAGGWVTNSVIIKNATGFVLGANNYSIDYTFDRFYFLNTTYMVSGGMAGNSTLVDYAYYGNSYINSDFGRNATNLVPGMFALALLGVGLAMTMMILKENGIV